MRVCGDPTETDRPTVTLSFDNGPTPGVTERVVEVLARRGLTARFFAVGAKLDTAGGRSAAREVVDAGHVLGGHTWSHSTPFGLADAATVDRELDATRAIVEEVGGDGASFRPYGVGGAMDERLMSHHGATRLVEGGFTCALWTSVPGDWTDPLGWPERALDDIGSTPWSVVVLHDLAVGALDRLDDFIGRALDRGAVFSTETPDACTPIREGRPTSSYDLLGVGSPPA